MEEIQKNIQKISYINYIIKIYLYVHTMLNLINVFFSEDRTRRLSVLFCVLIIVGIFASFAVRILPSIGIVGLFLTSLGYSISHKRIAQRVYWPRLLSFGLVYLLHAITGIMHSNLSGKILQQDLLLQLPFLLLPLSFLLLPMWLETHRNTLWLVLIGCCFLSALGATINYLGDYERINQVYLRSQVMPTIPDHIRFSLLISMAILVGVVLLFNESLSFHLQWITGSGIILLFIFQHLLAVRSGIVTLYLGGLYLFIWLGWQQKQLKTLLLITTLMVTLSAVCLLLFPTLQNKIINTRVDTEQVTSANAANSYSITGRVYSYKVAWAIIRQHPLLGVSKVNLNKEISSQYSYMFPQIQVAHYLMPHNQFIYNLTAYGIVGLLIFLVGYYYPLWVGIRNFNIISILLYIILTISFVVEYTLESQIGILIGIFFLLLATIPIIPMANSKISPLPKLVK